jgi:hypothetical protein
VRDECFGQRAFRLQDANMEFVPPPKAQPPSGEFPGKVVVTLKAPTCVKQIFYTLDGSTPDLHASFPYKEPFVISADGNTTVKAISYAEDRPPYTSDPVELTYTVFLAADPPSVSPPGGTDRTPVQLVLDKSSIALIPQVILTHPRTHAPTHPRTHAPTHPRTHAPTHHLGWHVQLD